MVDGRLYACLTITVSTTEKDVLRLDSMTYDFATAVIADWSELLNSTLKAVEHVTNPAHDHLEAPVVIIPA